MTVPVGAGLVAQVKGLLSKNENWQARLTQLEGDHERALTRVHALEAEKTSQEQQLTQLRRENQWLSDEVQRLRAELLKRLRK